MNITRVMIILFISSFIIHYFFIPLIMVNSTMYFTNHIGKIYQSIIVGIFTVIIETMIKDYQYNVLSNSLYALLFGLLATFIYLYRTQVAINDKQYLEAMIEQYSMSLLLSESIVKKTDNYDIAKLAKNNISQQTDEIRTMGELVKKV